MIVRKRKFNQSLIKLLSLKSMKNINLSGVCVNATLCESVENYLPSGKYSEISSMFLSIEDNLKSAVERLTKNNILLEKSDKISIMYPTPEGVEELIHLSCTSSRLMSAEDSTWFELEFEKG